MDKILYGFAGISSHLFRIEINLSSWCTQTNVAMLTNGQVLWHTFSDTTLLILYLDLRKILNPYSLFYNLHLQYIITHLYWSRYVVDTHFTYGKSRLFVAFSRSFNACTVDIIMYYHYQSLQSNTGMYPQIIVYSIN